MRVISGASLAAINQTSGLEPVIIVRIFWNGNPTNYCDRKFETLGLIGRLLEISGIEDIVDINQAASSVNMSCTLDDSDRSIKAIFDNNDIHKTYVQVLQWFSNIPLSDAFIIFEGEISSPIIWSEGARTLKFDIVTRIEDREVGFSAEEGRFPFLASNLVGKAWPVVFGTVAGLTPLDLNESPTAVFASGFGIVNEDAWAEELDDYDEALAEAKAQSDAAWILGLNNAYVAGQFKGRGPGFTTFPDDAEQADQYDTAASSYFAQSANYKQEIIRLQAELNAKRTLRSQQRALEFRVLPITGSNMPQGVPFLIEFGNYTANAQVAGSVIALSNLREKVDVNARTGTNQYAFAEDERPTDQYNKTNSKGEKFIWIDGGTEIKVFNLPRYYIVSIGPVFVLNLWGKTKYGKTIVPRNYYIIDYPNLGGGLIVTRIFLPSPLPSYPGFWEEGNLEVDCVSAVGSNVVDIMRWVIALWGGYQVDPASWDYVRNKVAAWPANFALTQRMNIVSFLKEVSFQARCAIWLNDRTYFIRFLPEELPPVETVTDSDVEVNSITVTSTETERLVTKFTALWRERPGQSEPNKIIYRYNILKYGTNEEEYDFFIYTNFECVQKAAEFWIIRKANTYKLIQCKVMLNKLRIEAFDPVQFNFVEGIVANGPVTGIITKSLFQPDDDTLAIEAWLPIRFGEMTPYLFSYPDSVSAIYPSGDPNFRTGNPFDGASGEIIPIAQLPEAVGIQYSHGYPFTYGTGIPTNAAETPTNVVTILNPNQVNNSRPPGINNFNDTSKTTIKAITAFPFKTTVPNCFFGEVVSKVEDRLYSCTVYFNGLDNPGTATDVRIKTIREGTTLPTGFPMMVVRTVWTVTDLVGNKSTEFEYWAQPAVWVPPIGDDEDTEGGGGGGGEADGDFADDNFEPIGNDEEGVPDGEPYPDEEFPPEEEPVDP